MKSAVARLSVDDEVRALLAAAGLPVSDLEAEGGPALFGLRRHGRLLAVVGVEVHGTDGLLRSLAVLPEARGRGLAGRLVDAAEAWASMQGVVTLHLLTQTAEPFFLRRGYLPLARDQAPPAIAATTQFASLCPDACAFMARSLAGGALSPARP